MCTPITAPICSNDRSYQSGWGAPIRSRPTGVGFCALNDQGSYSRPKIATAAPANHDNAPDLGASCSVAPGRLAPLVHPTSRNFSADRLVPPQRPRVAAANARSPPVPAHPERRTRRLNSVAAVNRRVLIVPSLSPYADQPPCNRTDQASRCRPPRRSGRANCRSGADAGEHGEARLLCRALTRKAASREKRDLEDHEGTREPDQGDDRPSTSGISPPLGHRSQRAPLPLATCTSAPWALKWWTVAIRRAPGQITMEFFGSSGSSGNTRCRRHSSVEVGGSIAHGCRPPGNGSDPSPLATGPPDAGAQAAREPQG